MSLTNRTLFVSKHINLSPGRPGLVKLYVSYQSHVGYSEYLRIVPWPMLICPDAANHDPWWRVLRSVGGKKLVGNEIGWQGWRLNLETILSCESSTPGPTASWFPGAFNVSTCFSKMCWDHGFLEGPSNEKNHCEWLPVAFTLRSKHTKNHGNPMVFRFFPLEMIYCTFNWWRFPHLLGIQKGFLEAQWPHEYMDPSLASVETSMFWSRNESKHFWFCSQNGFPKISWLIIIS